MPTDDLKRVVWSSSSSSFACFVQLRRDALLAVTHLQLVHCGLEIPLVRDACQLLLLIPHSGGFHVLIAAMPNPLHILDLDLLREECQKLGDDFLLTASMAVVHVKLANMPSASRILYRVGHFGCASTVKPRCLASVLQCTPSDPACSRSPRPRTLTSP